MKTENLTKEQELTEAINDFTVGQEIHTPILVKRIMEIFASGSVAAPKEEEKPQWKKDGWGVNPVELKSMADRIRKATGSGIDLEDLDILLNIVGFSSLRDQLRERDELIKELLDIAERHVYMHGNDDSVTDRRQTIARAKTILGI